MDRTLERTWYRTRPADRYLAEVAEVAERSVLDRLLLEASSADNPARVRAILEDRLDSLADRIETDSAPTAERKLALADIRRWQARPQGTIPRPKPPETPPGAPIGSNR